MIFSPPSNNNPVAPNRVPGVHHIAGLSADFRAELQGVQQTLLAASERLDAPLNALVSSEIQQTFPPIYAAVVLATGVGERAISQAQDQRIYLGSALQMLYIALHIHKSLLYHTFPEDQIDEQDKTLIGSTILAGDYCFSQAAGMAAQTDNPEIVAIFAQTLKTLSEGHLARLFNIESRAFDETAELFKAGIHATSYLVHLSSQEKQRIQILGQHLAEQPVHLAQDPARPIPQDLVHLSHARQARWRQLLR